MKIWICMLTLLCVSSLAEHSVAVERVHVNKDHFLRQAIHVENVTVWPVYTERGTTDHEIYTSLSAAQEAKQVVVREVGASPGVNLPPTPNSNDAPQQQTGNDWGSNQPGNGSAATVDTLVIENKGNTAILVLAGSVVKGGKQDRLIAQDFIVPPRSVTPVDAFCVEQGRWDANRAGNDTGGVFEGKAVLANYGSRSSGQYERNQGKVWENVAKANELAGKAPGSGTLMATIEEDNAEAKARRERIAAVLRTSPLWREPREAVGLAYAIDGQLREVRFFTHPKILETYFAQLVNTIALEGDLAQRQAIREKKSIHAAPASASDIPARMKEMEALAEEKISTRGRNVNYYRKGAKTSSARTIDQANDTEEAVTEVYSFH